MSLNRIVDQQMQLLDRMESDPFVYFGDLARVEAILAAVGPDGPAPVLVDAAERIAALRERYCAWEDEPTTLRRCAAALLAIDGLPPRFAAEDATHWVPPFALQGVEPEERDAAVTAWRAWRDGLLRGSDTSGAREAATRAAGSDLRAVTVIPLFERWEAELRDALGVGASHPPQTVLLLDWVAAVTGDDDMCRRTLAAVIGRWGVLHLADRPDDAVLVVPPVAARLATRCALLGVKLTSLGVAVESDLVLLLKALRDPRVRALTLTRVDQALREASAATATGVATRLTG